MKCMLQEIYVSNIHLMKSSVANGESVDKIPEAFGWQKIELKPNAGSVLLPLSWGFRRWFSV